LKGNGATAMATFPFQQNVTNQGHIIVKLDLVFTVRTVRARPNNGFFLGQPKDTNVQETTDQSPEYNGNNVPHHLYLKR
jgi:hypothetical protein